jgi:hypothetical protein
MDESEKIARSKQIEQQILEIPTDAKRPRLSVKQLRLVSLGLLALSLAVTYFALKDAKLNRNFEAVQKLTEAISKILIAAGVAQRRGCQTHYPDSQNRSAQLRYDAFSFLLNVF